VVGAGPETLWLGWYLRLGRRTTTVKPLRAAGMPVSPTGSHCSSFGASRGGSTKSTSSSASRSRSTRGTDRSAASGSGGGRRGVRKPEARPICDQAPEKLAVRLGCRVGPSGFPMTRAAPHGANRDPTNRRFDWLQKGETMSPRRTSRGPTSSARAERTDGAAPRKDQRLDQPHAPSPDRRGGGSGARHGRYACCGPSVVAR